MSWAFQGELPQRWSVSWSRSSWLALAGLVTVAGAWPVFVFNGSQASYVISVVAACCTASALAAAQSSLVASYLVAVLAVIGPEVDGQLGNGHAPLGSLRILDAAIAAAAATVGLRLLRSGDALRRLRHRPGPLIALSALAIGYAAFRWAMEGRRVDSFLRTDLRLIALAALSWFIVSNCRRGPRNAILWGIVGVGILAAIKAGAIHASGVYAIGSYDRLQASSYYVSGSLRTILIGGDTVLILVPAVALVLASVERSARLRLGLATAGVFCLWALGLSATRTSVLVALALTLGVIATVMMRARARISRSAIAAGAGLVLVILGVALAGGAASRLARADPPHVGLNFRKDEVESFLHTPTSTKLLGQGLAGRFPGKDVNGRPAPAGWAHELPVWIALKAGLLGLLCAALAVIVILRRALGALRNTNGSAQPLVGVAIVVGLLGVSMTLDRLALPEGIPLLMLGVFLISADAPSTRAGA